MEELLARHRKEHRDLQATITGKKKSASKKNRKGINDECTRLEQELKEQQAQEVSALEGEGGNEEDSSEDEVVPAEEKEQKPKDASSNGLSNGMSAMSMKEDPTSKAQEEKKPNRQKARLARRAAQKEELAAKAAEEAAVLPDLQAKESEIMVAAIRSRNLQEKAIMADGHCLYSAVADQLALKEISLQPSIVPRVVEKAEAPYRTVRRTAAEYMKMHQADFEPFMEHPFDEYVRRVGETAEWGGQLELTALAKAYGVDIGVLDGDGSVHEISGGEEKADEDRKIWLAYYRHGFGLGEHYNSLRKG